MTPAADRTIASARDENLGLEVTTRCNLRCVYCFSRAGLTEEVSLTSRRARQICTEGYATGYRHLHLTGGEPFLWMPLFELLDEAYAIGYQSVFINTNGTMLRAKAARRLARHAHLGVSVSLQGQEHRHDRMCGPGAYRQAIRGISAALDAGVDVTIFAAVGRSLLDNLGAFVADMYEKFVGIQGLTLIQVFRVRNDCYDLSSELIDPKAFLRLVRTVALLNRYGLETAVLNDPLVNVVAECLGMPWIPRAQSLCRPGRVVVRANDDIALAHSTWERFGRYQPGMIPRVLASRRYRNAVGADEDTCPSCRFVDRCRANGLFRPSVHLMDMLPETPYCQRVLTLAVQE